MLTWFRKPANEHKTQPAFDSIESVQSHIDHVTQVNDYITGRTRQKPQVKDDCHAECRLGQWMHDDGGRCANVDWLNSLCGRCEEFREHAAQAVLLTSMGNAELAKASMARAHVASDKYLECLALQRFHDL